MNKVFGAVPHPSDGDLVRYLDTEMSELEERRLQGHLAVCDECRLHLDATAARSRAASRLLGEVNAEVPDMVTRARALAAVRRAQAERGGIRRRRIGARLGAAAVVLIVLAGTVQPVRAWIRGEWAELRGENVAAPVAPPAPVAEPMRRSSVVAFDPRGARFDLQIEQPQAAGTVTIEVRDVERASAQVLNGEAETMLVLPGGLRVENRSDSRASYLVTVPSDVALVRVTVAGRSAATLRTGENAAPWSRTIDIPGSGR